MKGRLYRFTPAGGKPEHFTHSYESASRMVPAAWRSYLLELAVDRDAVLPNGDSWERVA